MAKATKIVRRPDFAGGGVTPDEFHRMEEHASSWISNAMRTDTVDRERLTQAVKDLYRVSGRTEPIVVIVPSPRIMAFAGGFAAAIWHLRKKDAATYAATYAATDAATYATTYAATYAATGAATDAATGAATRAATDAATDAATYAATRAATYAATGAATRAATYAATRAATDAATDAATYAATRAATYAATYAATDAATYATTYAATYAATGAATYAATGAATGDDASLFAHIAREILGPEHALFGLKCAQLWYNFYQGGNMWSWWDCYLTAARDILGLRFPCHEAYEAWERCAKNGGFRLVHEKFCVVSDFPERLRVDERNRPHCSDGPSHRWRDGWELYYWHGVQVTEQIVMHPASLTAHQIANEANVEVRRVMIERMGAAKYLKEAGSQLVHEDKRGKLWRTPRKGDTPLEMVEVVDSTPQLDGRPKTYFLRVKPGFKTATAAVAWSFGLTSTQYRPRIET